MKRLIQILARHPVEVFVKAFAVAAVVPLYHHELPDVGTAPERCAATRYAIAELDRRKVRKDSGRFATPAGAADLVIRVGIHRFSSLP
jgi:hypothetical protein